MDTSVLKNFAAETRRELAQGVAARLDAVLMQGSDERLDFPALVGKLEQAIAESSREAVIERVTYLWFNRLVAMRFMDARGYSPVGVVSPEEGVNPMQAPPQVVSDAFAGMIDENIVKSPGVAGKIRDIVNGVARSQDPYSDVFALLVDEYAQHFQTWVPAMFPEADDVSNLLLPANLLAAHSVVRKIAQTMTVEMCQDVEVIGWLYQFYIAERKDEVFDGFKKGKKAGAAEIPAATQLFTPNWIVRYLVQNTVGRTWLLNNPGSALREQMEYFVEPVGGLESAQDFVRISSPEELTVLDPAVGSGHMLTYAFDLLYEMYCEAGYAEAEIPGLILAKNLVGVELDERAGALAAFALTMKARERYRRFLRPVNVVAPQICVLQKVSFTGEELRRLGAGFDFAADYVVDGELVQVDADVFAGFWNQFESADVFGSLIRPDAAVLQVVREHVEAFVGEADAEPGLLLDELAELREKARLVLRQAELLSATYVAVVANPPYMGKKNMGESLKKFLEDNYFNVKDDLFSAFIIRNLDFSQERGFCGYMTPYVWMFIKSFKDLREIILTENNISSLIQLEYSGFAEATVPICTFTLQKSTSGVQGTFINLKNYVGPKNQPIHARRIIEQIATDKSIDSVDSFSAFSDLFFAVPNFSIIYSLTDEMLKVFKFSKPLSDFADVKKGMSTGNTERFLRLWHEVSNLNFGRSYESRETAQESGKQWFPHNKGGAFRKWYGNQSHVVNWANNGEEILSMKPKAIVRNPHFYFQPSVSWSAVGSGESSFRYYPQGFLVDGAGPSIFASEVKQKNLVGVLNSSLLRHLCSSIAPTLNLEVGTIANMPFKETPGINEPVDKEGYS